jgi:hypothetical protein
MEAIPFVEELDEEGGDDGEGYGASDDDQVEYIA